jgi:septal ring factor EnvC (AmiA/AmiB activator)
MLNWRPVYDIEQETERLRIASLESEKRLQESEKRLQQSEKRLKLLEREDRRLAELESRLDALLLNADSSSQTPPATDSS